MRGKSVNSESVVLDVKIKRLSVTFYDQSERTLPMPPPPKKYISINQYVPFPNGFQSRDLNKSVR